jgi:hypothetical protein
MGGNNVDKTTGMFLGSNVHGLTTYAENMAREFLSFIPYFINETTITSAFPPSIGQLPSIW